MQKMTDEQALAEMRRDGPLEKARKEFSGWAAKIEQEGMQRRPAGPIESLRTEYEAVKAIVCAYNGAIDKELYEALTTLDQFASAGSGYIGSRLQTIVNGALQKARGESEVASATRHGADRDAPAVSDNRGGTYTINEDGSVTRSGPPLTDGAVITITVA